GRWLCLQRGDAGIGGLLHGQCGIEAQPAEADAAAGLDLTDLPQLGADYGDRTDEAAQAGPVLGQDDRHVAGEVIEPTAYSVSWILDGCRPASPPLLRVQVGLGPFSRMPRRLEL